MEQQGSQEDGSVCGDAGSYKSWEGGYRRHFGWAWQDEKFQGDKEGWGRVRGQGRDGAGEQQWTQSLEDRGGEGVFMFLLSRLGQGLRAGQVQAAGVEGRPLLSTIGSSVTKQD